MPTVTKTVKSKVLLGLSGGVDSSLAALLLKEAGHEVVGVYLSSCLSRDESHAAEAAARFCGIGFETVDISRELEEKVCSYFVSEYCRGRTPSPCIVCNPLVKFKALFDAARRHGAELVATGHYARIGRTAQGEPAVFTGKGRNDQSYMLCRLERETYESLVFPLGELSKEEVRALAEKRGIPTADKPDSMEICFIPSNDRIGFIESRVPQSGRVGGNFTDGEGRILGPHGGIHRYTVGQRKGLGIALGYPAYVSAIHPETGDVVLKPSGGEFSREVTLGDCMWQLDRGRVFPAEIRVRHSAVFTSGTVERQGDRARLTFPDGVRAAAPGQFAVIYVDGAIAGSGVIEKN